MHQHKSITIISLRKLTKSLLSNKHGCSTSFSGVLHMRLTLKVSHKQKKNKVT